VDVDVRTTADERGVGAMVDATVAEGMKNMAIIGRWNQISKNYTPYKLQLIV